jgi:hypothetical protein
MHIRIPTPDNPNSIQALYDDLVAFNRAAMSGYGKGARLIHAMIPKERADFYLFVHVFRPNDGQVDFECSFNRNGRCGIFTHLFDVDGTTFQTVSASTLAWDEAVRYLIERAEELVTNALDALEHVHTTVCSASVTWPQ